jgi:ribonucleoside-diphosphate reductase alpha chain
VIIDMNVDSMIESAIERAAPISRQIWDAKYRLKTADGMPVVGPLSGDREIGT